MLTDQQWIEMADAVIHQSDANLVTWQKSQHGPKGTEAYSTSFGEQTSVWIWARPTGYSFEATIERRNGDEVIFSDSRRVTKKANTKGIPYRELLHAARRSIDQQKIVAAEKAMNQVVTWILAEIDAHPEFVSPRHLYEELEEFIEFIDSAIGFSFDYPSSELVAEAILRATRAGKMEWSLTADNTFQAIANGELVITLNPDPAVTGIRVGPNEFGGDLTFSLLTSDEGEMLYVSDTMFSAQGEELFALAAEQAHAPLRATQQVMTDAIFGDMMDDLTGRDGSRD